MQYILKGYVMFLTLRYDTRNMYRELKEILSTHAYGYTDI